RRDEITNGTPETVPDSHEERREPFDGIPDDITNHIENNPNGVIEQLYEIGHRSHRALKDDAEVLEHRAAIVLDSGPDACDPRGELGDQCGERRDQRAADSGTDPRHAIGDSTQAL